MSGASPVQALVADLAFFYRRETPRAPRFSIVGGGTGTGIADAARGIVDAGMSGRALAAGDPPGLVFTPLALSAVCLVTNVANPVAEPLPRADPGPRRGAARGVAAGGRLAVGSTRSSPVAFDLTSGARAVFVSAFVDLETPLAYAPHTFSATAQVRAFVLVTPAAWGYLDLAFTRGLHAVAVRGHAVLGERVVSGAPRRSAWSPAASRAARSPGSCAGSPATRRPSA